MRRLQSVLNAAARLIFNLKCSDHITDALVSLHWLRVMKRIQYKISVLSYKVLHDTAPPVARPWDFGVGGVVAGVWGRSPQRVQSSWSGGETTLKRGPRAEPGQGAP